MGFCWGAWAFCKASAEDMPLACGVSPHPSTKIESWCFKRDELEMLSKVKMPVFLMPAGNDADLIKPAGEGA